MNNNNSSVIGTTVVPATSSLSPEATLDARFLLKTTTSTTAVAKESLLLGEVNAGSKMATAVAAAAMDEDDVWGMPMFEKNEMANLSDEDYLAMVSARARTEQAIPVQFLFPAIQSYCAGISVGLLSYHSRSTLIRLDG